MPSRALENKKTILELKVRQKIFQLISKNPGLHFRDIQRRLKIGTGSLSYNLDQLIKAGLLRNVQDGEYLRYYTFDEIKDEEKRILELVRRKTIRRILLFLLQCKKCNNEEMSTFLQISPSTVSWHIKKLVEAEVLTAKSKGRRTFYSINSPEVAKNVLIKYKKSFKDKLVDRFVDMWET